MLSLGPVVSEAAVAAVVAVVVAGVGVVGVAEGGEIGGVVNVGGVVGTDEEKLKREEGGEVVVEGDSEKGE